MIRPEATGARWVALFLLAALLFSPPFLSIFSPHRLAGVPLLYVYLFISWGVVIVLLALAAEGGSRAAASRRSAQSGEDAEAEREP